MTIMYMYLSNETFTCLSQGTDNAQRNQFSPYFDDTMHKLFKNSMKPVINSIENNVQLRIHSFLYNMALLTKNETQNCKNFVKTCPKTSK